MLPLTYLEIVDMVYMLTGLLYDLLGYLASRLVVRSAWCVVNRLSTHYVLRRIAN